MRGTGGTIFKMDIPTSGMAKERWDEAIAKGELTPVEHAELEVRADGTSHWVDANAAEAKVHTPEAPKGPRKRGGKAEAAAPKLQVDPDPGPTEPATARPTMTETEFAQRLVDGMINFGDAVSVRVGGMRYVGHLAAGPPSQLVLDDGALFEDEEAFARSCANGDIVGCHLVGNSVEIDIEDIEDFGSWSWPYDPDTLS